MFAKLTFTHSSHDFNSPLCHVLALLKSMEKTLYEKGLADWDNRHSFLYIDWVLLTFLLSGNQFIFCKEKLLAICLVWNVVHWHSVANHNLFSSKNINKAAHPWFC